MIIQSIQHIVDNARDLIRTRVYNTLVDEKLNKAYKTYVECITYTCKGTLDVYHTKGQKIDVKM